VPGNVILTPSDEIDNVLNFPIVFKPNLIKLSFFLFWLPSVLLAQEETQEKKEVQAYRMDPGETIELNGSLDEAWWQDAQGATNFTQREPTEGIAPTESTVVKIAYDDNYLYIGAMLHDSDPSGILAYKKQRDAGLNTDDRFMWVLDTFLDGRTGYFFEINPAGLMGDGLLGGGGRWGVNKSWDGIWEARVTTGAYGWSAEIRIPFRTLNFNPQLDTWGINFQRTVRRKNEEVVWEGYRRNQQLTRPVHGGLLTGLEGMSQGIGLEAKPYAVAGWSNTPTTDPLGDPTDFVRNAGLDISYNITTSLRAAVTVNTDFAEVEVDQRRTNLTRFPQYFPERRDFFLEGSGVFSFSQSNGVTPYFSRNIGLTGGEPIPIVYGARLGGQAGKFELGLVQVRTGSETRVSEGVSSFFPAEDFTVARVKRALFDQSSIGAIYTRRASGADSTGASSPDAHTVGMDLDLFTSKFLGDKNLQFEAFFVWNSDPLTGGATSFLSRTARGVRLNFPNDIWRFHTSYRELDENFDPALGFTRRNGFRRIQPSIGFSPRPRDLLGIRQFEFGFQFEYLTDMAWQLETRKTDFKVLGLRFHSGDQIDLEITQLYERLTPQDEFSLRGVLISAGEYNTWSWRLNARTAGQRMISGNVEIEGGEFWSGDRTGFSVGADLRPAPGFNVGANYEVNHVTLPGGDFTTTLVRGDAGWHMSPWASLVTNIQYDDYSSIVGLFGKLRWIIHPGNDLFLVYTHNWRDFDAIGDPDRNGFGTLSRGATTKINYTHRF